jgi:hypothetical protein
MRGLILKPALLAILGWLISCPFTLKALCDPTSDLISSSMNDADVVMVVKINASIRYVWDDDDYGNEKIVRMPSNSKNPNGNNLLLATAEVIEVIKGQAADKVALWTDDASDRADLEVGKTYLVFCNFEDWSPDLKEFPKGAKPNVLWTWGCGGPCELPVEKGKVKEAKEVMKAREAKKPARVRFTVAYMDVGNVISEDAIPEVDFCLVSGEKKYCGKTDAKGVFDILVPAGNYHIEAIGKLGGKIVSQIMDIQNIELKLDWGCGYDNELYEDLGK